MGIGRVLEGIKKGNRLKLPFIIVMLLCGVYSLLFISSDSNHMPNTLPMTTNKIMMIGNKISIIN